MCLTRRSDSTTTIIATHDHRSELLHHHKITVFQYHFSRFSPPVAMEVAVKLTESPYHAPPQDHLDSSRPTIGFPLATALLLIVVIAISGIFSCCYHWDKLRHLRGQFSDHDSDRTDHSPPKPKPIYSVI